MRLELDLTRISISLDNNFTGQNDETIASWVVRDDSRNGWGQWRALAQVRRKDCDPFSFAHGKVWGASSFENHWERFLERSPDCRLPMRIHFRGYRRQSGLRWLRGVDCKYNKRGCVRLRLCAVTQFRLLFSQAPKCTSIFERVIYNPGKFINSINNWTNQPVNIFSFNF